MNKLGIMLGRLSPQIGEAVQSFPVESWRAEFSLAKKCGFEIIEWVIDYPTVDQNPIFLESGRSEIKRLCKDHNILVPSVCCDYFMEIPFFNEKIEIRNQAVGMLWEIISVSNEIGITQIELPMIGACSLDTPEKISYFSKLVDSLSGFLKGNGVELLLELSLGPEALLDILPHFSTDVVKVNYDMGNSAFWSHDAEKELNLYGDRIANIHIKDCTPEDYSVPLGEGNVNFDQIFRQLKELGYVKDFILQTCRGQNDVELAKKFKMFSQSLIEKHLA